MNVRMRSSYSTRSMPRCAATPIETTAPCIVRRRPVGSQANYRRRLLIKAERAEHLGVGVLELLEVAFRGYEHHVHQAGLRMGNSDHPVVLRQLAPALGDGRSTRQIDSAALDAVHLDGVNAS